MQEMTKGMRICRNCKKEVAREILEKTYGRCVYCNHYLRMHAHKRIQMLADEGSFEEWYSSKNSSNPFGDKSYEEKLNHSRKKHNLDEAVVIGRMKMQGIPVAVGVMDSRFFMASMGCQVGELITFLFENAKRHRLPVILFCCSGGARLQEGVLSLMQMQKTAEAVKRHSDAGLFYVSVLTDSTYGGVTASFALLADIIFAEENAMIGFAGPRVIEQNTGEKLPSGFQSAAFQMQHGFVDRIIQREHMREQLAELLKAHCNPKKWMKKSGKIEAFAGLPGSGQGLSTWEKLKLVRSTNRPTTRDYIDELFEEFYEMSGDRIGGNDHAIVAGIAKFNGTYVTVVGQEKGKKSVEEAVKCNWGMASPDGYRKALRVIKQAEKFKRPVICFIDTIGAACGVDAEGKGQGLAIARLLGELSVLKTPVLSIVIGEGESGGALALGVGNEVWMLENAIYSILSPEGYASILWKDNSRAKEAAEEMKISADELRGLEIVDRVIPEREPVTRANIKEVCKVIETMLGDFLNRYSRKTQWQIVRERHQRFRKF